MAETYNDIIDCGATWEITLFDKQSNGKPTDLTGCNAEMQLRTSVSSAASSLTLTSSPSAGIEITAATGRIDVTITASQTAALTEASYVYALELDWGNGVVNRLIEGTLTTSPEVVQ